jgi:hypothetical protein
MNNHNKRPEGQNQDHTQKPAQGHGLPKQGEQSQKPAFPKHDQQNQQKPRHDNVAPHVKKNDKEA